MERCNASACGHEAGTSLVAAARGLRPVGRNTRGRRGSDVFCGRQETSAPVIRGVGRLDPARRPADAQEGWIALRTFTLNINFLMTVAIIGGR